MSIIALRGNILGQTEGFIFLVLCSLALSFCWGFCLSTWFGGLILEWLLNYWGNKYILMRLWIQKRWVHLYLFLSTAIALGPRAKRIPAAVDWRRAAPVFFFALKKKANNKHIKHNNKIPTHPKTTTNKRKERAKSSEVFIHKHECKAFLKGKANLQ